ncbi:restriction endonuclease [Mycobacteroides abscessus subsp. bolletii]|uniref:restriction endonuclease n=1 Tax=Mycobacteroides abscessus TaxID=36809 RepID=UPI0019D10286|nr:restriction endonuclease [Mycobacteroides abscessus]MBN7303112.1 restriction endonuclease [Mycobacteroides abscessus subsp. bolletii]
MSNEQVMTWQSYEEVARFLLQKLSDLLGLGLKRVADKQTLVGDATDWEIDGRGVPTDGGGVIVIECRRLTTSKVKQNAVAALAYSIRDLGASGGIIVTLIGVQNGGQRIAEREGIKVVRLAADSTTESYLLKFLGSVVVGPGAAPLTLTGHVPTVTVAPVESGLDQ